MLNQLVYESGYAYWNWFLAHHSEKVLRESYQLALLRFNAVKLAAEGGDRPYIDTIEARIQVQSRNALWKSYETEELNARVKVSTYLWNEQLEPLDLAASKMPMEENETALPLSRFPSIMELDSLIAHHPYLKMNNLKIKTLEIDQKLKKEQLKPVLNLNYQVINEPVNYNPLYSFSPNNNKFGVQFEMPILLRKERGDLQLSKLKIQDEQLSFTSNQVYIQSKIEQAQNDYLNAQAQVQIYQQSVMDSRTLFEAEKRMFEQGESSLFLVNARELTYIQAKLKYLEVLTKCQQAALSYEFSLARLIP
jgi:outer membrane protein TolC